MSVRRVALVAFVVALALRVARLGEAPQVDPLYDVFLLDSAYYDELARGILEGGLQQESPFLMAPLYGYVLAALYALRGALGLEGPGLIYGVQALLGAGTAAMAALLGERAGGRLASWTAGLLCAVYPVAILYDAKLLSVTLATFLATLGALLLARVWDRLGAGARAGAWALGCGLTLGLATLARGNLLLSLPFVLLLVASRAGRGRLGVPLLLLLGLAGPLGLSFAHNAAAGSPALVSVNGGVNLYRGNNPYFVDEAVEPFRLPAEKDALATRSLLVASVAEDRALSPRESDQYWTRRTLQEWGADPLRYVGLLLRKTVQVLGWREISDNIDHEHLLAQSRMLGWIPPLYGPMVALALVALVGRARDRARRAEDAPILVLLVTGIGSIALFFVVARYRLPLVPLWAGFAGAGLTRALELWRSGARRALGEGALAAGGLGALLALPATSAVFPWSWLAPTQERPECLIDPHVLRAAPVEDAYRVAFDAMMHGREEEAERQVAEVTRRDPEHAPAGVMYSYLLLKRGAVREAIAEAARVVKVHPCEEKAWFNLGSALLRSGNGQAGLGALHKAAQLDPYDTGTRTALGQAWMSLGGRQEAKAALDFSVRWDPSDWQARALRARIALEEREPGVASKLLDEALLLAPEQIDLWGLRGLAALGVGDLEGAEAALLQGEANARKHPELPSDPVLVALRKAIDAPMRMPDKMELVAKPRPGIGP